MQTTLVALRAGKRRGLGAPRLHGADMQQASASLPRSPGVAYASTRFNAILTKVESGDGSLTKLMNDPALYNDLRRVATRVDSLMLDLMKNPRKYLKFSVF
jgi:phospholipid/cholesterol/gamma-HCH transport system substrate-binding protein